MSASGRPLRVMVADDEKDMRELIAMFLEADGMEVCLAADGGEALELACKRDFDVLVLDERMPVMYGSDMYVRLRAEGRVVPAILATASENGETLVAQAGFAQLVRKPFLIEDLIPVIRRVASSSR